MAIRVFRALAAALLLVGLTLTTVTAGGWATIVADSTNPPQPKAGDTFTFGFTVLQHGVTPAGWVETPTFVGTNATTGERIEAKATGQGADRPLRRQRDAAERGQLDVAGQPDGSHGRNGAAGACRRHAGWGPAAGQQRRDARGHGAAAGGGPGRLRGPTQRPGGRAPQRDGHAGDPDQAPPVTA